MREYGSTSLVAHSVTVERLKRFASTTPVHLRIWPVRMKNLRIYIPSQAALPLRQRRSDHKNAEARFDSTMSRSKPTTLQWPMLKLLIRLPSKPARHRARGSTPSPVR